MAQAIDDRARAQREDARHPRRTRRRMGRVEGVERASSTRAPAAAAAAAVVTPAVVKTCACCGAAYTLAGWQGLRALGPMVALASILELRNCTCGSTLARLVSPEAPSGPVSKPFATRSTRCKRQ